MKDLTPCICERCNAEHYGGDYFLCPDCEDTHIPAPGTIVIDIATYAYMPTKEPSCTT